MSDIIFICDFCGKKFPMNNDCFIEVNRCAESDDLGVPDKDDLDVDEEWKWADTRPEDQTDDVVMCVCDACRERIEKDCEDVE